MEGAPVVVCCAPDEAEGIRSALAALADEGHEIVVVDGADAEPKRLATVIDRLAGEGVYVLCRSPALGPASVEALREILLAHHVPFGRTLTVAPRKPGELLDRVRSTVSRAGPRRAPARAAESESTVASEPSPATRRGAKADAARGGASTADAARGGTRAVARDKPKAAAEPAPKPGRGRGKRGKGAAAADPVAEVRQTSPAARLVATPKPISGRMPLPTSDEAAISLSDVAILIEDEEDEGQSAGTSLGGGSIGALDLSDLDMPAVGLAVGLAVRSGETTIGPPPGPPAPLSSAALSEEALRDIPTLAVEPDSEIEPARTSEPTRMDLPAAPMAAAPMPAASMPRPRQPSAPPAASTRTSGTPIPAHVSMTASAARSGSERASVSASPATAGPTAGPIGAPASSGARPSIAAETTMPPRPVTAGTPSPSPSPSLGGAFAAASMSAPSGAAASSMAGDGEEPSPRRWRWWAVGWGTAVAIALVIAVATRDDEPAPSPKPDKASPSASARTEAPSSRTADPEPRPSAEAEPDEGPENSLPEEPPTGPTAVGKLLAARKIRALDILLVQAASDGPMEHDAAIAHCTNLDLEGVAGWRLPTVGELWSLNEAGLVGPDFYWSSTPGDTFGDLHLAWHGRKQRVLPRGQSSRVLCVHGEPAGS